MKQFLDAACGCHTGRVRSRNEDNLYFDGRCLEQEHSGLRHPVYMEEPLRDGLCLAVFDGIGGEAHGEAASFAAARRLQQLQRDGEDYFYPERSRLRSLTTQLNEAVAASKKELRVDVMGTTMAALYFGPRNVYVCNVGDSRAYRLRQREFMQLSRDHTTTLPGKELGKAALTRYLGMDPEETKVDPYIARGELLQGDRYLLCSDGLTDMLSNFQIADILLQHPDVGGCVSELIRAALERGGRDNVTAIVCDVV